MEKMKLLSKVFYWGTLVFLFFIVVVVVISKFNFPKGYRILSVQSGSMQPVIMTGSVVVVKPENVYKKGDIITFFTTADRKQSVTHRVFELKGDKYITKGDANDARDATELSRKDILGKVLIIVPFLGFLVSFTKTLPGLILLVIIPATIIVYSQILDVKKEVMKFFKKNEN